jgi:hypothetical protein
MQKCSHSVRVHDLIILKVKEIVAMKKTQDRSKY